MMRTRRAAIVRAPRAVGVEEVELPSPGSGQVHVRVEGCGVCGSDLPAWQGRPWLAYPRPPGAPGHEAWGHVAATGPGVAHLRFGDRVAGLIPDAYAETATVDAAALVRLPDALRGPLPAEALACAVNAFDRSNVQSGDLVAVAGVGFLGAVLVALAAHAGADVVALGRRPYALSLARSLGARAAVRLDEQAVPKFLETTGGRLADVAIEATGHQRPLDVAGELTRVRGRLVIAGYHQDARTVNLQLWNWRGLDVVNAHERDRDAYLRGMRRAFELVADGRLNPAPLVTHTYPLDRLGDAFQAMEERPEGFLKAVIAP
jgi:threonine dehydrogenase-like Zn-dependent dehydrogenase